MLHKSRELLGGTLTVPPHFLNCLCNCLISTHCLSPSLLSPYNSAQPIPSFHAVNHQSFNPHSLFHHIYIYSHLIKWSVSSTSQLPHSLNTLSSLLTPCHLHTSIPNSAVPPLTLVILLLCLLQSIHTHRALHSLSINLPVILNSPLLPLSNLFLLSATPCISIAAALPLPALHSVPLHPMRYDGVNEIN